MLAGAARWTSCVLTYCHARPPYRVSKVCVVIRCLRVCTPSVCCVIKTLGLVRGRRPTRKVEYHAFLVIIKLDPMATVPDTAKARPIYLSSSMKGLVGGERNMWEKAWLVVNTQSATRLDKRIYVSNQHKKGTSCILSYLINTIMHYFQPLELPMQVHFSLPFDVGRRHFYSFIFISFKFSLFSQVFP